jgi:hypothetical protein
MAIRKSIARTSTPHNVSVTVNNRKFRLSYYSMMGATFSADPVKKSQLYSLARKLAKQAIEKDITIVDASFNDIFMVLCHNNVWYQVQDIYTPKENLLLPDFRLTEAYQDIINENQ